MRRTQRSRLYQIISPAICITALAVLTLLLIHWWHFGDPGASVPSRIAAVSCAALFAILGLRFVPRWIDSWAHPSSAVRALPPEDTHRTEGRIFLALLVLDVVILLMAFVLRWIAGYRETFVSSLSFWRCLDSNSYLEIAQQGYLTEGDKRVQLVFLPGYPLAVRLMMLLIPNALHAGLIVSGLCFAGSGSLLYRLARLDWSHRDALRAVKYLCILPGVFFFVAPMSESLFLLLCIGCLYCARTGRWLIGGLLGALAAFTRSLGVTLMVPLLFELIQHWQGLTKGQAVKRTASVLLVAMGFVAYLGVNVLVAGNPFQFTVYQREHWGQQLGWFFNTAAYQTREAISNWHFDPETFVGLWGANLASIFGSLMVMILAVKRLRLSHTAWFIVYFVVAIGATWLLSAPRYMCAFLPLPLAVAALTRRESVQTVVEPCCIALGLMYFYAFVMRWQVW